MSGETSSAATGGPVAAGLAGWGVPGFLPPNVRRRMLRDDAREAIESKHAEAEREARAEELHQRAMRLYAEQAELRGEVVTAMQLASGQVPGRPVAAILEAARQAGDHDDVITAARLHREGHGDPEPLHIEVGEPRILAPAARSATGRAIATRARKFRDLLEARGKLAAAERAAQASKNDYGLVDGVTLRSREDDDPVVAVTASRRRGGTVPADSGLRFR